ADEAAVRACFDELRQGTLAGANVTVPWKRLALELADEVDPTARETGAVNVIRPIGGKLVAYNTDAPALAEELGRGFPGARSAVLIGKGGAALGCVSACRLLDVKELSIVARGWTASTRGTWSGAAEFEALGVTPLAWPDAGDAAFHGAV